jgi:hypothetical protein
LIVAIYLQGLKSNERDGIRPPKDILMLFLFNEGGSSWRGVGFMIEERRELEEQLSYSFVSLRACVVGISASRDS